MIYPKQLMTITELAEMGFSRYKLNMYANDPLAPVIKSGRGKALFDTTKLDDYLLSLKTRKGTNKKKSHHQGDEEHEKREIIWIDCYGNVVHWDCYSCHWMLEFFRHRRMHHACCYGNSNRENGGGACRQCSTLTDQISSVGR